MPRLSHTDPPDPSAVARFPQATPPTGAVPDATGDLIAAARAGDGSALGELYRRHNPSLVRYLHVHAAGEEQDLASEVWIDVARSFDRFEGDVDGFRRWMFTIARRRAIDAVRKRARRRTDPIPAEFLANWPGAGNVERAAIDAAEGMAAAHRIVATLSRDQAEVVLLRIVGGLSVTEVAEIVGRPRAWVSVTQHRALRRLAEQFGA